MKMRTRSRRGVSELYASIMMIGVTLSFGSFVAAAAVNQFNLAASGGSLAAALAQQSAGTQVSLVYGAVTPGSGSCTTVYGPTGVTEGKTYTLVLYDYGSVSFTPVELFDNATLISSGSWSGSPSSTISASSMTTFTVTLSSCAHPTGQTFLLMDANGDEVQVGT